MTATACHWYEAPDGGRWMVPGCMTRIHDPDADPCDCPTLAEQLGAARAELQAARREIASVRAWNDAITRAVHDHRDGIAIMRAAARHAETPHPAIT